MRDTYPILKETIPLDVQISSHLHRRVVWSMLKNTKIRWPHRSTLWGLLVFYSLTFGTPCYFLQVWGGYFCNQTIRWCLRHLMLSNFSERFLPKMTDYAVVPIHSRFVRKGQQQVLQWHLGVCEVHGRGTFGLNCLGNVFWGRRSVSVSCWSLDFGDLLTFTHPCNDGVKCILEGCITVRSTLVELHQGNYLFYQIRRKYFGG